MDDVIELREQLFTYEEYSKNSSELSNEAKLERDTALEELDKYKELFNQLNKKVKQYKFDIEESRKTILELILQL